MVIPSSTPHYVIHSLPGAGWCGLSLYYIGESAHVSRLSIELYLSLFTAAQTLWYYQSLDIINPIIRSLPFSPVSVLHHAHLMMTR